MLGAGVGQGERVKLEGPRGSCHISIYLYRARTKSIDIYQVENVRADQGGR